MGLAGTGGGAPMSAAMTPEEVEARLRCLK